MADGSGNRNTARRVRNRKGADMTDQTSEKPRINSMTHDDAALVEFLREYGTARLGLTKTQDKSCHEAADAIERLSSALSSATAELAERDATIERLRAAVNELLGLIRGAQDQMSLYIQPDGDADTTLDNLLGLLDGPRQRKVEKQAKEALSAPSDGQKGAI